MKDIGLFLSKRRAEVGLTMKEVADTVGVSEATVSRWEAGEIKNMRRDRIAKLAEALNVSPVEILGMEKQEKPASGRSGLAEEFMELFVQLTPAEQKLIVSQIKGILSSR